MGKIAFIACWLLIGCAGVALAEISECPPWATCLKTTPSEKPVIQKSEDHRLQDLIRCCLAYCVAIQCNSPPASKACTAGFLQMIVQKYGAGYRAAYGNKLDTYAAIKKNYFDGALRVNGVRVAQCR